MTEINGSSVPKSTDYSVIEELLSDTIDRVVSIDERTEKFSKASNLMAKEIAALSVSMASLTTNTATNTVALTSLNSTMQELRLVMKEFQASDMEKWNVAAGKRQVPMLIFILVVATLCFVIMASFFSQMKVDLVTKYFELRNAVKEAHDETQERIDTVQKEVKNLEIESSAQKTNLDTKEDKPIRVEQPVRVEIEDKK